MAPERIRGSSEVDGRTDLFSVGVVLYETMTSVSPFAASSASASLAAVLERHVDADDRIEPRLFIEIQRALSKRQYERHASADEMGTALRAAIGETEGALEGSLRRSPPPAGWEDEVEPYTPAMKEHRTIDGQTFGVLPRSRIAPAVWIGVGAAVGLTLAATIVGLRTTGHAETRASTAVQPTQTTMPAPPASAPAASPLEASGSAAAAPGPSAPLSAVESPAPRPERAAVAAPPVTTAVTPPPANVPAKTATPGLHAPPTPRPKPIATTPGF
jgi:serine/threonine-protein kinase